MEKLVKCMEGHLFDLNASPTCPECAAEPQVTAKATRPAYLYDAFAVNNGRIESLIGRPQAWHCGGCGLQHEKSDDYRCKQCRTIRPLLSSENTLVQCKACGQWNGFCTYCEWCGAAYRW